MMDVLHTVGIPLEPEGINIIENNLYLGNLAAAKNVNILNEYNINYILTIDICPLPYTILQLEHIKTKFIQLADLPKEDLLSHFDDTDLFIEEGISHGAVLVHCCFGISRSASVVIAYIMKKYQMSYDEAFDRVKAKRSIVYPNEGFVSQLQLYKLMGFTINRSNMHYKLYRLSIASDRVRKEKIMPQDLVEVIQPNPRLEQIQRKTIYRCKKCRQVLASESNLITHSYKNEICKRLIFVEPIAWMNSTSDPLQGKMLCPKCSNKLGFYNWTTGTQCPCGIQVVPAFYLTPSKIDLNIF